LIVGFVDGAYDDAFILNIIVFRGSKEKKENTVELKVDLELLLLQTSSNIL
jgi:hypothetical protein